MDNVDKLYKHAVEGSDTVLYAMLQAHMHHPENWVNREDFLIDVVFALSAVNKDSRKHLTEVLSKQTLPPQVAKFVTDGAWSSNYL